MHPVKRRKPPVKSVKRSACSTSFAFAGSQKRLHAALLEAGATFPARLPGPVTAAQFGPLRSALQLQGISEASFSGFLRQRTRLEES